MRVILGARTTLGEVVALDRRQQQSRFRRALRVPDAPLHSFCTHCGSTGAHRIGYCSVCDTPVCEKCGNTQITLAERKVMHDSCLRDAEASSFSMIKFVK